MQPVVVAVQQTPYASRHAECSLEELIYRTVRELLNRAGIGIGEIDHIAIASSDGLDGRSISSMVTGGAVGDHLKDLINASSSGEHALVLACLRVMSGRSRLALVVNWAKPSESPIALVDVTQLEPFYHRSLRLERTAHLGLQAQAYSSRHHVDAAAAAAVVEKNRANAVQNPLAVRRSAISAREAAASDLLAWPLRTADVPPLDDGVVAMLVADAETARSLTDVPAVIAGFGWNTDPFWGGERDLAQLEPVARAAQSAYRRAGIQDPQRELNVVEVMDVSSYHELMAYEALGLAEAGEGPRLLATGATQRDGRLPVNPSGGLQGANPDFAAGLARVAEVTLQVTGTAGDRQVAGARIGLAATVAGFAAQTASVFILAGS